jgi:hypothetical protein
VLPALAVPVFPARNIPNIFNFSPVIFELVAGSRVVSVEDARSSREPARTGGRSIKRSAWRNAENNLQRGLDALFRPHCFVQVLTFLEGA